MSSKIQNIIIVEKTGSLKLLNVKEFKEEELYKKCGFKKADGFNKQTEWLVKYENIKYNILVYGKTDGRANCENKYDFPPPIDNTLFFGNCAIVAQNSVDKKLISLTIDLWLKIYEKLFGGFENLALTSMEDEEEDDELANIPKEKKTKNGYLKDGFVVDSDGDIEEEDDDYETEDEDADDIETDEPDNDEELVIEDLGSELSEESYDYN